MSVADTVFVNKRKQKIVWNQYKPQNGKDPIAIYFFHVGYQDAIIYNNPYYERLAEHGLWVFSYDPHGQGRSEPKKPNNLLVEDYNFLVDDSLQFLHEIVIQEAKQAGLYQKIPLFIGGESMGGLVQALSALQVQDHVDGLVLMAPAIGIQMDLFHSTMLSISGILDYLVPRLRAITVARPQMAFRDQSNIERLQEDPTFDTGNMRVRTGLQLIKGMQYLEKNEHKLNIPLIIIFGDQDKVCDPKHAKRLYDKNQNKNKEFVYIKDAWHALIAEPDSQASAKETAKWIDQQVQRYNSKL